MGVERFRTFDDARRALWLPPGHPAIFDRLRRLGELARPSNQPRGVRRFRSIEEAKAEAKRSRR
jgi:hypothetical protein